MQRHLWAGETLLAAACPNFCLQGGGKGLSMLYSLLQGQFSRCLKGFSGTRHGVLLPRATPAKRTKSITPKFRLLVASCPNILFLLTSDTACLLTLLVPSQLSRCNMRLGNPRPQCAACLPGDTGSCTHIKSPLLPVLPREYQIRFTVSSAYLASI